MTHMPVSTVAKEIGEHGTRIWRVIGHHVKESLKGQNFSDDVRVIGVDEYSHKGHEYITVFLSHPEFGVDGEGRKVRTKSGRVLFVTEGKDKNAVLRFLERFTRKAGDVDNVEVCTSDMIHGFRSAMRESFSKAEVVVDKFHVIKNIQDAVDSVRRREMRSREKKNPIFGNWWGFSHRWPPLDVLRHEQPEVLNFGDCERLSSFCHHFSDRLKQFITVLPCEGEE